MKQNGFWKGFGSAIVVMFAMYGAVSAYAGGQQVQVYDAQSRMAEATVVIAKELQEMNDNGLKVKLDSKEPVKIEGKVEMKVPVEIRTSSSYPIEVKVKQ
ncbi:MAG: hypothetical protein ABL949_12510 [Fimbriimonadaceae bacterium]